MRVLAALSLALAGLGLAGCRDGCVPGVEHAVEVLIMEPGGPYAEPITIRYRVDGGEWVVIDDTSIPGARPEGECTERGRCLLGEELEGGYEVEVQRGIARARFETVVTANACHVMTVTVPLSLPAV
jgi:hypothetical protein